jgi:hypothetical protein
MYPIYTIWVGWNLEDISRNNTGYEDLREKLNELTNDYNLDFNFEKIWLTT